MKAAIVKAPKSSPVYGDFDEPVAQEGQTVVHVKASALTQLTKSRASGSHYSSDAAFPAIAGTDGVGLNNRRTAGVLRSSGVPLWSPGGENIGANEVLHPLARPTG